MAEAAEQIAWTEKIIAGLRETAELEADQIRAAAHRDGALAIREVRDQIAEIVDVNKASAQERIELAEAKAQEIVHAAEQVRGQAFVDAETIRKKAKSESSRIVALPRRSPVSARQGRTAVGRGGGRCPGDPGAGGGELARTQRELHDLRRAAKDDELRIMSEARARPMRCAPRHGVGQ